MQEEDRDALDPHRRRILELLRAMGEAMEGLQDDYARAAGLHATDLTAVSHLSDSPEPLSMRELGQRLQLTAGAVTGLVDRLERAGHVIRLPDAHDRRRTRLRLTARADDVVERFFGELAGRALQVMDGFDDAELAVIERFLERLPAVLDPSRRG